MSKKFTPGPYVCYHDSPSVEPNWHIITNESRMRVLANVHIEPGNEVDLANAKLFTAAPDLYDALRSLLLSLDDVLSPDFSRALENSHAVLAKARGEI